jgi:ATP-dependent helicase HrpB
MPLHPRLAHMVVAAGPHGATTTGLALAAMASEGGGWGRHLGPDLADRLAAWREAPAGVGRIHRQLCRQLKLAPEPPDPAQAGLCAALAFPDRIGQRRQRGSAELRLTSGRGARLGDAGAFADADFVVVWESEDRGSDAMVRLAAGLDRAVLEALAAGRIREEEEVRFDAVSGRVVGVSRRMLGALLLAQREMRPTAAAVQACLLVAVGRHGITLLPWTERLLALRQRLCWLHQKLPDEWPAFDEAALGATADFWLGPWLAGVNGLGELTEPMLEGALRARLDGEHAAALVRLAPAAWSTPLGAALPIDYGQDPPTVACRLQALLGLDRHPTILDGRQPLSLQLLSPAGRPIQVTMDLPGFWRGSYALVRKELRGRYPKHPWPEDPLEASPWRPGMGRGR